MVRGTAAAWFAASAVLLLIQGCGGDVGDEAADLSNPTTIEYASALEVDLSEMRRTASGLYIGDEVEGAGEGAARGNTVLVHYTGWLPDGTKFDSSLDRGEPFSVPAIGSGMVIPGWEEGLVGMRPGGERLLVIPPGLAYGAAGAGGVIPPNATLVFRVELLQILP